MIPISYKFHRNMKYVRRCELENLDSTLVEFGAASALEEGERPLGFYRATISEDSFIITNRSFILSKNGSIFKIKYFEIDSCHIPDREKSTAKELLITLKNENVEKIIVDGGEGKFRDVFSVATFILHIMRPTDFNA